MARAARRIRPSDVGSAQMWERTRHSRSLYGALALEHSERTEAERDFIDEMRSDAELYGEETPSLRGPHVSYDA